MYMIGCDAMDRKIISISGKRQITIPLKFFKKLNFTNQAECYIENDALVIRPLSRDNGEFSVEILRELVAEGYSGEELIHQFEVRSKNIKKAITALIQEADEIAEGKRKGATMADIFEDDS